MEVMSNNISVFLKKKAEERNYRVHLQRKKENLLQDESTVDSSSVAPLLSPSIPERRKKKKEALRERGRKTGTGRQQAGWLVMDETMPFFKKIFGVPVCDDGGI